MVFAGVLHHLDLHTGLTERPIHLQALTQRIGFIAFALDEKERRLCVCDLREWALSPGSLGVLPRLTVEPAVIPSAAYRNPIDRSRFMRIVRRLGLRCLSAPR